MRPAARVAAAAECLAEIAASLAAGERAADRVLDSYVRSRRYIGGGDRREISRIVWTAVRHRASLDYALGPEPRLHALGVLVRHDGLDVASAAALCDGSPHALAPLDADDLARLAGMDQALAQASEAVRLDLPEWALPGLRRRFGADLASAVAAFDGRAELDLRVNTLKTDRAGAAAALAAEGIDTAPSPLSPVGLRVTARGNVLASRAYRDGLVEVQDEGSQLAALLVGARPGEAVLDFCAGGGGKTLALAAQMKGRGRLVAHDIASRRLSRLAPRLERAGATAELELAGVETFDRVLLDVPCTLSGTWRRSPDARWRWTDDSLAALHAAQGDLLDQGAGRVRPGGRLVYVTCSLMPEEDEDQVEAFLARSPGWRAVPAPDLWRDALGSDLPAGAAVGPGLLLQPLVHGTDGFFVAALERGREA
ncbi:RsmB/NOP family class I SAM-dependent RNA methyltransferase [Zavarzinia sp. CC-PAN008]|uniref:RsmB/NOP family class I SAM-dependent RNA methyltransferase n=1 Tax=Zavarzinia sp. CC-PAN008 TaxID=3243332 RepID=UPI003F74322A